MSPPPGVGGLPPAPPVGSPPPHATDPAPAPGDPAARLEVLRQQVQAQRAGPQVEPEPEPGPEFAQGPASPPSQTARRPRGVRPRTPWYAAFGLAVFALTAALPALVLVAFCWACSELVLLSVWLGATGALHSQVFESHLVLAVVVLAVGTGAWLAAWLVWRHARQRDALGKAKRVVLYAFSRGYVHAGLAVGLCLLMVLLVRASAPGRVAVLAGAAWTAAALFLWVWLPVFLGRQIWRLGRHLSRLAAARPAVAGAVAAAGLLAPIAAWALLWPGPETAEDRAARQLIERVFAPLDDALSLDNLRIVLGRMANEVSERELFDEIRACPLRLHSGQACAPGAAPGRPAAASRPRVIALADAGGAGSRPPPDWPSALAAKDTSDSDATAFDDCVQTLYTPEGERCAPVDRVQYVLRREFRLTEDDAYDIVLERLLRVCTGHAEQRYENLPAVLWRSARNAATSEFRHRRRFQSCSLDNAGPDHPFAACLQSTATVESVRYPREYELLRRLRCRELSDVERQVIDLRLGDDLSFGEIDRRLNLGGKHSKDIFHNAIKRLRHLVKQRSCRLPDAGQVRTAALRVAHPAGRPRTSRALRVPRRHTFAAA